MYDDLNAVVLLANHCGVSSFNLASHCGRFITAQAKTLFYAGIGLQDIFCLSL